MIEKEEHMPMYRDLKSYPQFQWIESGITFVIMGFKVYEFFLRTSPGNIGHINVNKKDKKAVAWFQKLIKVLVFFSI